MNHQPLFTTEYNEILESIENLNPLQYGKSRNFINGAVTYLSPYISRGVISTKQVLQSVLAKGYKPFQIEKFIQELAWRDYFQRVQQSLGDALMNDIKQAQPNCTHQQMCESISNATTGIEAIDKHINLLYETGYMHNHVRMYTASIVCNIGKAYWLQPSQWMYHYLLDGDLASNTCSWQWVAGAFSSKKYYCNQENINKYTFSKQEDGFLNCPYYELTNMEIPVALQETRSLELKTILPKTNSPIIDNTKPTLIYNSYNLDPLWRKEEHANRILLLEPSHFAKYPVSKKVIDFILALSKNIYGISIFVGEINELITLNNTIESAQKETEILYSKEHPLFAHYPGIKDERDWMFPQVKGYYNSFFAFWKKGEKYLKDYAV